MCAHSSCAITDCDPPNCPEKRAIHLVNDMPQGQKWPENLAAFHTAQKQDWGWQRSCALCLAAATLLPQTATGAHKQPIVTKAHDAASPRVLIRHAAYVCLRVDESKHRWGKKKKNNWLCWMLNCIQRKCAPFSCQKFLQNESFAVNIPVHFIFPSASKLMVSKPKLQHETSTTQAWNGECGVTFLRQWASHAQTKGSRAPRVQSV